MKIKRKKWQEFEVYCEKCIRESLPSEKYKITHSYRKEYNGELKVMDIHIAEKKKGGRGFVVECKCYTSRIYPHLVRSTMNYKRLCKASKAIILVNDINCCSQNALTYAKSKGVDIIEVKTSWTAKLFRKLMKRKLELGLPEY